MISNNLLLCLFGILTYFADNTAALEAIIGGYKANIYQFPYQVALKYPDSYEYHCGGGIISRQHVLTAANCVVRADGEITSWRLFVVAGTNELDRINNSAIFEEVCKISVPATYLPFINNPADDIAVLQLKHLLEVTKHKHIKSLKLPANELETYVGNKATIAGFGWNWIKVHRDKEVGGRNDTALRFAEAIVLSQTQQGYPKIRVPEKQIGARIKQNGDTEPHGTCNGDTGSPLVRIQSVVHTVIGVLNSSPFGCSERNDGAIYARVSHYLNFIKYAMISMNSPDIKVLKLCP